jgi:hypothetical protein
MLTPGYLRYVAVLLAVFAGALAGLGQGWFEGR